MPQTTTTRRPSETTTTPPVVANRAHDPLTDPLASRRTDPLTSDLRDPLTVQMKENGPPTAENYAEIIANPANYSVGQVAAAYALKQDIDQSAAIDSGGAGTRTGTQSGESRKSKTDCTIYVLEVLAAAFAAKGQATAWREAMATAQKNSGNTGFKGTELLKAMQDQLGWVGVFFAPDARSSDGEHAYSARKAKSKGSYYGLDVDHNVTDYRPETNRRAELTMLEKLENLSFGVVAARGGRHMAMIVGASILEVHWSSTSDDHDLFEMSALKDWAWGSGIILMPPDQKKIFD